MKYNIYINQKAIIDLGLDLDVIDMSIFDFFNYFSNSSNCVKVFIDGKQYFWISHTKIINDLPIIRINTRQGILKRINKLIEANLIERADGEMQRSYYRFGVNYDSVYSVTDRQQKASSTDNESLPVTDNESCHYNDTINNNTKDNKDSISLDFIKLLEFYNTTFNRKIRVVSIKAKKNFRDRLKEGYIKEDILNVFKNVKASKWHIDKNFEVATIEFLGRSQTFEMHSSRTEKPTPTQGYQNF